MLHRVPPGSLVFEQAETPSFAQFLLAGSVELLGVRGQAETLIELLQPVDLVIPTAVVTGQPYLMRARVYQEAHLLLISAETFRQAMATDHALCRAILGCLAAQFQRQVRSAKNLRLRSAEERVGCYLLAHFERENRASPVRLPIDKKEIAAQLGIAREAFSRALSGMEKFGIRIVGWRSRTPQPPKRGSRWTLSSTASSQSRHFRRGGLDHRADPLLFAFIVFNAR